MQFNASSPPDIIPQISYVFLVVVNLEAPLSSFKGRYISS